MFNNGGSGHGQFPNYNNPQGVPVYPQTPNTLKRKIPPHLPPQYLPQQQLLLQQQNYGRSLGKQIKLEPPIAVPAMFNPNQGQQGQNIQQPQQMVFQGQGQGQQQNAPQQNIQGQPGQQPQQRRMPVTEEERQKFINSVKGIIERFGPESPQAKQAQRSLSAMMQYIQRAQQGQPAQGSDAQATAQGRPGMGHSVSSLAQFQPPPNADPQRLHNWRLSLTTKYTQGQQRMKQIRDQLQIHSQQMSQLTQAGQTHESPQVLQMKTAMNELAKQYKQIESWCTTAKNSGHIIQNPTIQQQSRLQAVAGGGTGGASGGQQQGGAGAAQMQQQSASMGVEQQGQQQNVGVQQQAQPQQGQALQQVPQQQQAHQQVPQQVQGVQQHLPPQQRPTAPQQTNQVPNASQHPSPAANRQQQPLVRPSMSPTAQTPIPQPMHQSPAMSPQLSQQGIQQGQQPVQQQIARQIPAPVQQIPGGPQAVRQSPAPGTPATPTAQHPQQQVRDASVPPRPGSAAPVAPAVQGQVPVMPQQGQLLPPQPGQPQQVPPRMTGASAQSPPPQQQTPQLPDRNIANRMPIPKTLNIEPKGPVPIQTRPTLSGGANTAGSHVMGTPALVKNPAFEFDEGGMGLLSKRKLEELVKQIDPDEKLDPEVEESVLELVDEFIDTVVTYACKMAKLRGSDTLDIKDMQIILERNWNIRVPGYAADEIRTVRKFAPAQGYVQKMNALAAGKALNQTNLKGGD